jgi:5-methylcytosine-specific restriction enzyme A
MARDFSKRLYNSAKWRKCREGYIASKHGLCERCLSKGTHTPANTVHHIEYLTPDNINDVTITLNWDNLELLCATCHQHEHYLRHGVTRIGTRFDEYGDLVIDDTYKGDEGL